MDDNKHFDNLIFSIPLGLVGSLHEGMVCFVKAGFLLQAARSKGIAHLTGVRSINILYDSIDRDLLIFEFHFVPTLISCDAG